MSKPVVKRDNLGRLILPPRRPNYTLVSHDVVYYPNGRVKSRMTVWKREGSKTLPTGGE